MSTTVMRIVAILLVALQVALFVGSVAIGSWVALFALACGAWTVFCARSIWRNCAKIDRLEGREWTR